MAEEKKSFFEKIGDALGGKKAEEAAAAKAAEEAAAKAAAKAKEKEEVAKKMAALQAAGKAQQAKIEDVAKDVIKGKYGNGEARKEALEKAGYDYHEVQSRVNELLK